MSVTLAKPRSQSPRAAAATVDQFWSFVKQLAGVAEAAASAPPEVLVKAGGKSRSLPVKPDDLVAALASLSEKLDEVCSRLVVNDGTQISSREREGAAAAMKKMIQDSRLIDSTSFVERRRMTRQALSKALKAHRVFYVEVDGLRYIPSFFLDARLERRQLEGVSKALGELPGPSKLQFFTTKKASLSGKTPLDALADGQYSLVRTAAQGFAER
jgi:hypothetical protein